MSLEAVGRLLLFSGIGIALLGGLLLLFSRLPILKNFGRLPGDVRIEAENVTCFAPIVSMILLSIILTIILNIVLRLLNR